MDPSKTPIYNPSSNIFNAVVDVHINTVKLIRVSNIVGVSSHAICKDFDYTHDAQELYIPGGILNII